METIVGKKPKQLVDLLAKWLPLYEGVSGPLLGAQGTIRLMRAIGAIIKIRTLTPSAWRYDENGATQSYSDRAGRVYSFKASKGGALQFSIWYGSYQVVFQTEHGVFMVWHATVEPTKREHHVEATVFAHAHNLNTKSATRLTEDEMLSKLMILVAQLPRRTISARRSTRRSKR